MSIIRSLFWGTYRNEEAKTEKVKDDSPNIWNWDEITKVLTLEVLMIEVVNAKEDVIFDRTELIIKGV